MRGRARAQEVPRVSAKSVYRDGRVIRLMARRGRLAMALVVATMEAAGPWRSLIGVSGVLRARGEFLPAAGEG